MFRKKLSWCDSNLDSSCLGQCCIVGDLDVVCVHFPPRGSIWWLNGHIVARGIVESLVQVYLEFK